MVVKVVAPEPELVVERESTVGFLPMDQRDTRYYLFSRAERYECSVPVMQSRSLEDLRFFGTFTSGEESWDRHMANERVVRRLTINQMVEFYKKGVDFGIRQRPDTKTIYQRITDHLVAWRNELETQINPMRPPLEDLIALENFAHSIYEHAKWHFRDQYTESLLLQRMRARVSHSPVLAQNAGFNNSLPTIQNPPPERESMEKIFSSRRTVQQGRAPSLNGGGAVFAEDPSEVRARMSPKFGERAAWK